MEQILIYLPLLNLVTTIIIIPVIGYIIRIEKKIAVMETTLEFMKDKIEKLSNDGISYYG